MDIKVKRIYEEKSDSDGYRVLVDRLWPRGVSKERAALDLWLKEIAPSTELRKWFGHDPDRWEGFVSKYVQELNGRPEILEVLGNYVEKGPVTLLYAAKDTVHNEALVLKEFLEGGFS